MHPNDDVVRPRLGEVDLDHLERTADGVEEGGCGLHGQDGVCSRRGADPALAQPPRAALTSAQVVTVETFWSAKSIEAWCQSAFIVEHPSSGTTT